MDIAGICEKWQERTNNALEIQKETGEDFVEMKFSKSDLRELRLVFQMQDKSILDVALEKLRVLYLDNAYCKDNESDICADKVMGCSCEDCLYQAIGRMLEKLRNADEV